MYWFNSAHICDIILHPTLPAFPLPRRRHLSRWWCSRKHYSLWRGRRW